MILVRNLRRLLSGNSILLLLIMVFSLSSCGSLFKTEKHKRRSRPVHKKHKKKRKKTKKENIDTVKWPSKDGQTGSDNSESTEDYGTVKKSTYLVDLLIPLDANLLFNDLEAIENNLSTNKFLHYYAGILMALEDAEKKGIGIQLNTYDATSKGTRFSYLKSKVKSDVPDVIIGPKDKRELKDLAMYARRNNVTMVSPWVSIPRLTSKNPNFVQIKPSLDNYYKAITEHIDKNFPPSDVYLIGLKGNRYHERRMKKIHEFHEQVSLSENDYNDLLIAKDSLDMGETMLDSLFAKDNQGTKVFVIPNWSARDEEFIYNVLRRLNIEKGENDFVVYGMPVMMQSNKIGYNLFKSLNIRVASAELIKDGDWQIEKFKKDFYDNFKTFPLDYAYEGYDMMTYVINNLSLYGTKFQYFVEDNEQNLIGSSIKLERFLKNDSPENRELDKIDYFENVNVNIIGFKLNKFEKLQ